MYGWRMFFFLLSLVSRLLNEIYAFRVQITNLRWSSGRCEGFMRCLIIHKKATKPKTKPRKKNVEGNGRKAIRWTATVWQSQLKIQSSQLSAQKCMPNSLWFLFFSFSSQIFWNVVSSQIGCTGRMRNCQREWISFVFRICRVASRLGKFTFLCVWFFGFFGSLDSHPTNDHVGKWIAIASNCSVWFTFESFFMSYQRCEQAFELPISRFRCLHLSEEQRQMSQRPCGRNSHLSSDAPNYIFIYIYFWMKTCQRKWCGISRTTFAMQVLSFVGSITHSIFDAYTVRT